MKVQIRKRYLLEWLSLDGAGSDTYTPKKMNWTGDDEPVTVSLTRLDTKQVDLIQSVLIKYEAGDDTIPPALKKFNVSKQLLQNPTGTKINNLETWAEGLKLYLKEEAVNKWVFRENGDGSLLAYFVKSIHYSPASGTGENRSPAVTVMHLSYYHMGEVCNESTAWSHKEVQGKFIKVILDNAGFIPASELLVSLYDSSVNKYKAVFNNLGGQYITKGTGYAKDRYWREPKSLYVEGVHTKLVSNRDKKIKSLKVGAAADATFWFGSDSTEELVIPLHPYVSVYDLDDHADLEVNASLLEDYEYNEGLIDKLILPEEDKTLIHMLGKSNANIYEDIVEGKSGGSIILTSGLPGTGKTLTAEIYSEYLRRPLYVVQCSQLGVSAEGVEKALKGVLSNASRWKAVLLIDEADVYIHKRGSNMEQNAVIGVFLRLLEGYRGVMFLTTNRADVVDDAIMSRVLAHIQYSKPTMDAIKAIFTIQAAAHQWVVTEEDAKAFAMAFPNLSGRGIKNLLKLTSFYAQHEQQGTTYSLDYVKQASKYAIIEKPNIDE